ncbi:Chymotrypsin-C [Smittium culicis]|uniref:Chymotrypsin-C n=1 Tax=Smittium culicis TaxID=133412 RepID=A0A1R1Y1L0_9FUNG|nr:Chymotrypsin-C [Smittium culicis]
MKISIYSIFIASAISTRISTQSSRTPRIVNGSYAKVPEFPYISSIDIADGDAWRFCGGLLVTSKHVVTAAHCVYNGLFNTFPVGNFTVGYGQEDLYNIKQTNFNVESVVPHPVYERPFTNINDIAILELKYPVDMSVTSFAKIYDLPITDDMVPTAAGWGETEGPFDSLLKKANMFVVSNSNCSLYEREYTDNNGFAICLESDGISSPCSGDSGGPLALSYLPDAPVIGITSKSASHNRTFSIDCNYLETTWYFTNVFAHIDFISENTGVPKELLLYSTEGTAQEKDIEIQKITGSKREIVTPPEDSSSSSSSSSSESSSESSTESSSESSTESSSESSTESSSDSSSESSSDSSSESSSDSSSESSSAFSSFTTIPTTNSSSSTIPTTTSSSTTIPSAKTSVSFISSSKSSTTPSLSTTSSTTTSPFTAPINTTSINTTPINTTPINNTPLSTTSAMTSTTQVPVYKLCVDRYVIDDGYGNLYNCKKDDKICGRNSDGDTDCIVEPSWMRFCFNDILMFDNYNQRDCSLEGKKCGRIGQEKLTCIEKEPSMNLCDSSTILNYGNGTTVDCSLSGRVCGEYYVDGFACISKFSVKPFCIDDRRLLVDVNRIRNCEFTNQFCGITKDNKYDCVSA